jgi:LacI family transcriptional regulator
MTHRFPIKEIAMQAGLGTATVDRAINNRAHVSPQTRRRVTAAIKELEQHESQLAARGRRMVFDFVVEAPTRFSRELQRAAAEASAMIGAAVCRPRFVMQEVMTEQDVTSCLSRIEKRGSDGVCIKARNLPAIAVAIDRLVRAKIPVVTIVTDIPHSDRLAYVGLDNVGAGRTAAYLVSQSMRSGGGTVLTTKSQSSFLGERERGEAFGQALATTRPDLTVVDVSGGSGIHYGTADRIRSQVGQLTDLRAVYSMGGGNRAILDVLADHRIKPDIFISHDLDRENRGLLVGGDVTFVLHHDLRGDIQNAYLSFLRFHGLRGPDGTASASTVQILSPSNLPSQA